MSWIPLIMVYGMLFSPTGELYVPTAAVRDRMSLLREGMTLKQVEAILNLRDDQILLIATSLGSLRCEYKIGPEEILWLFYVSSDQPNQAKANWVLKSAELELNRGVIASLPYRVPDMLDPGGSICRHFRPPFERALALYAESAAKE